jgi:hypothetical protein
VTENAILNQLNKDSAHTNYAAVSSVICCILYVYMCKIVFHRSHCHMVHNQLPNVGGGGCCDNYDNYWCIIFVQSPKGGVGEA